MSLKKNAAGQKIVGKIVLKVQDSGRAFYLNPRNNRAYELGRPNDAFNIMRQQGVGITNNDLANIPIGLIALTGQDSDGDGLTDGLEEAIGTNKFQRDSDGDGYADYIEVFGGYNPLVLGERTAATRVAGQKQVGKILLQVEGKGEAWYVNPSDAKRYYLGRPADAFTVMRQLSTGITNNDFNKLIE